MPDVKREILTFTNNEIVEWLRDDIICRFDDNASAWARRHGFSVSFVHDVLKYRKLVSPRMAGILGFEKRTERQVVFVRKEK